MKQNVFEIHFKVIKMLGQDFALTVISGYGARNFCWWSNIKLMIQNPTSDPRHFVFPPNEKVSSLVTGLSSADWIITPLQWFPFCSCDYSGETCISWQWPLWNCIIGLCIVGEDFPVVRFAVCFMYVKKKTWLHVLVLENGQHQGGVTQPNMKQSWTLCCYMKTFSPEFLFLLYHSDLWYDYIVYLVKNDTSYILTIYCCN